VELKDVEKLVEEAVEAASKRVEEGKRDLEALAEGVIRDYEEYYDVIDSVEGAIREHVCRELMPDRLEECYDIFLDYDVVNVKVSVEVIVNKEEVVRVVKKLLESAKG
jgi:hypothetical protein